MFAGHWKLCALMVLVAGAAVLLFWDSGSDEGREASVLQTPDDTACRACHNVSTPFIVKDFDAGDMGEAGVMCTDCHFAEPTDGDAVEHNSLTISVTPSPADCARCHESQVAEFNASKHFIGWTKMESTSRYIALPDEIRGAMCEGCHNIGIVHADGSQGKCDSCHTRHSFSSEEARKPESCGTCHMGPDHPQIEAYLSSKHGVMYTLESDSWDWSDPDTFTAPVCVTCHMPDGTHDVSYGISIGGVSNGAVLVGADQPFPIPAITEEAFIQKRAEMVAICSQCHSEWFALSKLSEADAVKNETALLVGEAREILIALYEDGLLDPMPADRTPNPVTGFNLTLMGQQLYSNTSGIETLFFQLYKYHFVTAWKGGYHFSPDYTHWYGWAEVNHDLELIKAEDRKLRAIDEASSDAAGVGDQISALWVMALAALVIAFAAFGWAMRSSRGSRPGQPPESG